MPPLAPSARRYSALVPACIEQHLAAGPGPVAPWSRRFEGVVLCADVAGFTALAEDFAAQGPVGGERLAVILNACFGRLADEIARHGGDVVGFAGDAPVAIFELRQTDAPGSTALHRARTCAHAIQAAMPAISSAASRPLAVRVGIAAGRLAEFGVGGSSDRWQWIVGGTPIVEVGQALARTAAGNVHVVGDAAEQAESADEAASSASWHLERAHAPADLARRFVPRSVAARLDAGQAAWAAELRRVTTMFVTLRGVDYDAADALDRVQPIVLALQESVHDSGGSVNQLIADDKGTTLVAAWGGPGHGHDDDAERAARSAGRIQSQLNVADVDFGVGLATGRTFCGWRGNEARREYALIGSVVNLAARLSSAATREVLADEATSLAAKRHARFENAGPYELKGRGRIQASRLTAARVATAAARPHAGTVVVGRLEERRRLVDAVNALAAGRGGTVFVQGEAGAGKSTLIADAVERAREAGIKVLAGAGTPVERGTGFDAWRGVIEGLLDLAPDASAEVRVAALQTRLAGEPHLADRAPLLGPALDVRIDETPTTAQMTAPLRAAGAKELLVHLVEAEARRRAVLLVFDDAHWFDSLSWSAVAAVTRRLPGLLTIAGLRPMTDPPSEWQDLAGPAAANLLDVGRLSDTETRELAGRILGVEHLPDTIAALVLAKAGGHALFVTEFTRWLRETGTVVVDDGRCRLVDTPTSMADLPASVEGVILNRLDRLPASLQLTLKVASVLGPTFSPEALVALHPGVRDAARLRAELSACERLGILQLLPGAAAFSHALLRDAAYGLIPHSQRVGFHRDVANWYEGTAGSDDRSDAILAHHREGAEEFGAALEHLGRAGEGAWSQGASRETIRFLRRAMSMADQHALSLDTLRRARWHRLAGQAGVVLGDLAESRADFHRALGLLGTSFPSGARATRNRLLRELGRQAIHIAVPRRRLRSASPEERASTTETVRTLKALGDSAFFEADHLTYMTTSLTAINRAERAGVGNEAAVGYTAAAYTASLFKVEPLANRWWRLAGEPIDAEARLTLLMTRSMVALQQAQWEGVDALSRQVVTDARRLGAGHILDTSLVARLIAEYHRGRIDASLATSRELLESAASQFNEQRQLWAHQAIGAILHAQGDLAGGAEHVRRSAAMLPGITDPLTIAQHCAHRVVVALYRGDLEAATPLAELAERMRTTPPASVGTLDPFHNLALYSVQAWERALQAGGSEAAPAMARQARWACKQLGRYAFLFPFARPYHAALLGRVQWLAGHRRRAARTWGRAVRQARALEMSVAEAEATLYLGHYAHADSAAGGEERAAADAAFRRMGLVRYSTMLGVDHQAEGDT